MRNKRFLSLLLVLLLMLSLCVAGCSSDEPEPTSPETTAPTPPSAPADPTEAPALTAHQKLVSYLKEKGPVKREEKSYTFTMSVDGEKILWNYSKETTDITITLTDGAKTHPVTIKFVTYDATAEIEAATFSGVTPKLTNFHCWYPDAAPSLASMSTSVVATCFKDAAKVMEPAGVDLVALGFVNYYS